MLRNSLLALLALAVGFSAYAGAKIEWNKLAHDFGAFTESSGPATAVFTYFNTGDEPLVVTGARANCGCTTPKVSAEVLQPGDSATLSVTYDPAGRPGRFEKKVYVDTNTDDKRSTLTIRGVSVGSSGTIAGRFPVEVGPLRLAHTASLMGALNRGQVKSVFESGYNASTDTLRPVVTDVPEWIQAKVLPETVPPGEQVSFSLYVNSTRISDWDLVSDTITIAPFEGSSDIFRMPVVVTVNEDFSKLTDKQLRESPALRHEKMRLDPVEITSSGGEASLEIHNDGKSPLKLHRIYTLTPGVKVDMRRDDTVKGGKSRKFKIRFEPSVGGSANASSVILTVISNDPLNPKTSVVVPVVKTAP